MFGKVKIGAKEVEMLANAATPYRYQQIFHEDYIKKVTGKEEAEPADLFTKLGFVMAMQAAKKDMSKVSIADFYTWLEGFEPSDVFMAVDEISSIYYGNEAGDVDPKENNAQQSEK